jgi:hypothetical protein
MAGVSKQRRNSLEKLFSNSLRREFTQHPEDILRVTQALVHKAKCGDLNAIRLIAEYIDGKPHQSVDMDVEVHDENLTTASESELLEALRKRMAGVLPRRPVPVVDSGGTTGSGSDQKPH